MEKSKVIRITLLISFAICIFISLLFISILGYQIANNQDYTITNSLSQIIILFIVFLISILGFRFTKAWNRVFSSLGKLILNISIALTGITIILLTIHYSSDDIAQSIQPTIDTIVISYIENSSNPSEELQIAQEILLQPQDIEKISVKNLTPEQSNTIIKLLNISPNPNNSIRVSKTLISIGYETLKQDNPELLKTPLPITMVSKELKNVTNLPLEELSLFYPQNENASLYIMYPSQDNSSNSSEFALQKLRNQCEQLPENIICSQILLTSYNNLIEELPIPQKTIEEINTIEKINSFIIMKTNHAKLFVLIIILGIVITIICREMDRKINNKDETIEDLTQYISKNSLIYFIFPVIGITALYFIFTSSRFITEISQIVKTTTNMNLSFSISSLPIFITIKEIFFMSLLIHYCIFIILLLLFGISLYIRHKKEHK